MDIPYRLLRLEPNSPGSWALWPILEDRARVFCKEYATDTPPDALIQHLRRLFVDTPALLGAWVLLTDQQEIIGHLIGWVDIYWGQPYIIVHQVRLDSGHTTGSVKAQMCDALDEWAWTLNDLYQSAASPLRVMTVRWMTERPDAWIRYFPRTPHRHLTVLSVPIGMRPEA